MSQDSRHPGNLREYVFYTLFIILCIAAVIYGTVFLSSHNAADKAINRSKLESLNNDTLFKTDRFVGYYPTLSIKPNTIYFHGRNATDSVKLGREKEILTVEAGNAGDLPALFGLSDTEKKQKLTPQLLKDLVRKIIPGLTDTLQLKKMDGADINAVVAKIIYEAIRKVDKDAVIVTIDQQQIKLVKKDDLGIGAVNKDSLKNDIEFIAGELGDSLKTGKRKKFQDTGSLFSPGTIRKGMEVKFLRLDFTKDSLYVDNTAYAFADQGQVFFSREFNINGINQVTDSMGFAVPSGVQQNPKAFQVLFNSLISQIDATPGIYFIYQHKLCRIGENSGGLVYGKLNQLLLNNTESELRNAIRAKKNPGTIWFFADLAGLVLLLLWKFWNKIKNPFKSKGSPVSKTRIGKLFNFLKKKDALKMDDQSSAEQKLKFYDLVFKVKNGEELLALVNEERRDRALEILKIITLKDAFSELEETDDLDRKIEMLFDLYDSARKINKPKSETLSKFFSDLKIKIANQEQLIETAKRENDELKKNAEILLAEAIARIEKELEKKSADEVKKVKEEAKLIEDTLTSQVHTINKDAVGKEKELRAEIKKVTDDANANQTTFNKNINKILTEKDTLDKELVKAANELKTVIPQRDSLLQKVDDYQAKFDRIGSLFVEPVQPNEVFDRLFTEIEKAEEDQKPETLIRFVTQFKSGRQAKFKNIEEILGDYYRIYKLINRYTADIEKVLLTTIANDGPNLLDRMAILFLSLDFGQGVARLKNENLGDFKIEVLKDEQLQLIYFVNYFISAAQIGKDNEEIIHQIDKRVSNYNLEVGKGLFPESNKTHIQLLNTLIQKIKKYDNTKEFVDKMNLFFLNEFNAKVKELKFDRESLDPQDLAWLYEMMFNITFHTSDFALYFSQGREVDRYKNYAFLLNNLDLAKTEHRDFVENSMTQSSYLSNIVAKAAKRTGVKNLRILLDKFYIKL